MSSWIPLELGACGGSGFYKGGVLGDLAQELRGFDELAAQHEPC